jgi:hypothetical protein
MTSTPQEGSPTPIRPPKRGTNGFIASPLIKVLVGPEDSRSELYVHEKMITNQSKFFSNALSGRWNNSETKTINLYDLDPELTVAEVSAYLEAVYTKHVASQEENNDFTYICKTYVVAEQMLDIKTQNLALQALYERQRKPFNDGKHYMPGSHDLRTVYEGTASAKDPMRRLLVDIYSCFQGGPRLTPENVAQYPKEFLLELALVAPKDRPIASQPLEFQMDKYFEKEEGDG